jgi:uncharacterized protein (TIGR02001 family)
MKHLKIVAALGLLGAAGAAQAGVSSTWTVTNDYDFRSYSQSAKDPAIQASLDYAHDSGWYVGAWASNIDFGAGEPHVEVDLYTGFAGGDAEAGLGWDVGLVYYAYPDDSDYDYLEAYAGIERGWLQGKLWFSPDFAGDLTSGDTEAFYVEGNATIPLPENFSILLHAGYSFGDYWDDVNGDEVFDYSVGLGYTYDKFEFALKYVDQDSDVPRIKDDVSNNEGRIVFTVSTTFPW